MELLVIIIIILLCLFCVFSAPQLIAAADDPSANFSTLDLKTGLNISVDNIARSGAPAIAAHSGAYFLPILSSPSFNSSNSSRSPPPGFSLGFWYKSRSGMDSDIFLALCGGLSGNNQNLSSELYDASLRGSADTGYSLSLPLVRDGYAVPVWFANVTALSSVHASLMVVDIGSNSKQLQLVDYDGTVFWSVSNVELMVVHDSGLLSIYNTTTKTHAIWESTGDILFKGQKLMAGSQLTSGDSTYFAYMEQGGLVLRSNALHFMNEWPAPYWAIPAVFNQGDTMLNVSAEVLSSHCNPDSAYVQVSPACNLIMVPGPCNSENTSYLIADDESQYCGPLSFMKLENDGRLVIYAASELVEDGNNKAATMSTQTSSLWDSYYPSNGALNQTIMSLFGFCAVPNACGPLGLCAPFAKSPCTCPPALPNQADAFVDIDGNDPERGCKRSTLLPSCVKDEHVSTTDFLELNHTASIFLFSGWDFAPVSGKDREFCMQSCSSTCSCNGFFYQVNTSSCFFFTDEMSLINVTDHGLAGEPSYIQARNYVTYLKKFLPVVGDNPAPPAATPPGQPKSKLVVIAVVSSLAFCLGLGLIGYLLIRRSRSRMRKQARLIDAAEEEEALRDVLPLLPTRFSFEDLHVATEGFSKLLGAGGCGSVYAGTLPGGRKVAVKTLELTMKGHSKEFLAEVATIGQTNHQNIVRLVGFCWEVSRRLLVYEYMERGSLDQWVFMKAGNIDSQEYEAAPMLDWQTRYNVVLGIVRGLCYLHEECSQPILHFDIKPQNILLDGAFMAKLADFGMSRLMQRDVSQIVTGVRGTPGYIPPEWLSQGSVSKKSDVYSLGMVMLEIVGGRKNVDLQMLNSASSTDKREDGGGDDAWYFPSWAARKCEQGLAMEVVDKRLKGLFNEEEVKRLIYTAFWCIQEDPGLRPFAPTMLQWLEGNPLPEKPPFANSIRAQYRTTTPPSFSVSGMYSDPCVNNSSSSASMYLLDPR